MLTNTRLGYLWCGLTGGILLMSSLPGSSLIYKVVAAHDLIRWVHFIAYALVASIPVAAWRLWTSVLASFAIAVLGIAFELLHAFIQGCAIFPQNVLADLFGVACGILLGMNIRVMRNSA